MYRPGWSTDRSAWQPRSRASPVADAVRDGVAVAVRLGRTEGEAKWAGAARAHSPHPVLSWPRFVAAALWGLSGPAVPTAKRPFTKPRQTTDADVPTEFAHSACDSRRRAAINRNQSNSQGGGAYGSMQASVQTRQPLEGHRSPYGAGAPHADKCDNSCHLYEAHPRGPPQNSGETYPSPSGMDGRVTGTMFRRSSSPVKSSGLVVYSGRSSARAAPACAHRPYGSSTSWSAVAS
jgi:hypothetical protein